MRYGFRDGRTCPRCRRLATALAALALAALVCGCGRGAAPKQTAAHVGSRLPAVCAHAALAVMARTLGVEASRVAATASRGSNVMPQCGFSTKLRNGKRVAITVNVDDGPQPYFVLERTIVEASQIFSGQRLSPAPEAVLGLGLEAAWFPAETHLMATDGSRLITTTIEWPGATTKREIVIARSMTRPYLKTPHGKAAQKLANGFPSS
jgi:hypothetical protein